MSVLRLLIALLAAERLYTAERIQMRRQALKAEVERLVEEERLLE